MGVYMNKSSVIAEKIIEETNNVLPMPQTCDYAQGYATLSHRIHGERS